MRDIAQRLLDGGNDICRDGPMWPGDDMLEGYAEITRLRALVEELKADRIRINDEAETEIKRLREALEPFAGTAESDIGDDEADTDPYRPMLARRAVAGVRTVGDFRRARKALEGGE